MKLSIVIPCLGRQSMLDALLDQIRRQVSGRSDVEVIVIDDGSNPPLSVETSPLIVLLRNEQPAGAPAARQRGFLQSSGHFVHFHDSDDLLGHQWIERTLQAASQEPAPDMIVSSRMVVEKSGAISFWSVDQLRAVAPTPERLRSFQRFINRIGPLGGVTFSRGSAEKIIFHKTPASQDWLMYDDALKNCREIFFDKKNYFVFNKTQMVRISNNARSRTKGYVLAARARFASRGMRRVAARLYCTHGAADLTPLIRVRHRWLKRAICELLARFPRMTGQEAENDRR